MHIRRALLKTALYGAVFAVVTLGATAAFAWTGPSASPPSGNAPAPINVSSVAQTKSGSLTVTNSGRAFSASSLGAADWSGCFGSACTGGVTTQYGVYANGTTWAGFFSGPVDVNGNLSANNLCLNGSCISSWSGAGGGSGFTGSGSTNYLAKFTGGTSLGNSDITDSGGVVSIDTTGNPGYALDVGGSIRAENNWLRTTGNTGWYSDTYGGGWYMQDGTWIRSFGSKPVYMDSGFDSGGGTAGVNCGGGMGNGYTLRVCGSLNVTGGIYSNGTSVVTTGGTYTNTASGEANGNGLTVSCSSGGYMYGYQFINNSISGAVQWATVVAYCEY